jgi:diguanylate cyclase (GGDEF)-like protein
MKRNLSSARYADPVSHDGIHDSLTFLPAPAYFYEYLYREISTIERSQKPLTLIKIIIRPIREYAADESHEICNYEISIMNFAKALNRSIRRSDFGARIGRYEFVIALDTTDVEPRAITERLLQLWHDEDYSFSYSSASYRDGDGAVSLLNRLDGK